MSIHAISGTRVAPIILAGGYGSFTMNWRDEKVPKVLEEVNELPLIIHVANVFWEYLHISDPFVVVNSTFGSQIAKIMKRHGFNAHYVVQEKRVGNAGAVELCLPAFAGTRFRHAEHVAVLYADMPCWRSKSVGSLINAHITSDAKMSIFLIDLNQSGCPSVVKKYGRVIYDEHGKLLGAYEPRELPTDVAMQATKVNPSAYVFHRRWLEGQLSHLDHHDPKDGFPTERWLPDLVHAAARQGSQVTMLDLEDPNEALGVNTLQELQEVRSHLKLRSANELRR